MKKMFTLILLATGTIQFATAQFKNQPVFAYNDKKHAGIDDRSSATFDKHGNDAYFSFKEKQEKLQRIDREFDQKIDFVKHNWRLNRREKSRQTDMLQMQRKNEINRVEYEFEKSNHNNYSNPRGRDERH